MVAFEVEIASITLPVAPAPTRCRYRRADRSLIPALAPVSENFTGTVLPSLKIELPSAFTGWSTFDQAAVTVTVTAAWSNVLQPVNADGSSVFKLGSTVPVKFALTGASAGISNLSARLYLQRVGAGATGTVLEAISTSNATTGNLFRYDATSGQYIFNLNTKTLSAGTYQLRIDLGDGVLRTVNISLR